MINFFKRKNKHANAMQNLQRDDGMQAIILSYL
eukprot:SAG31_NODE_567_length_14028_cov_4.022328_7_plen_33_part_00